MAHEVFICYANQDQQAADEVCAALEKNAITCWMAPRNITAGQDWDQAIMDAIPDCRMVVIIFSTNSNDSPYCASEIRTAFDMKKEILPVLIDGTLPRGRIALYLGSKQWFSAQTPPLHLHLKKLVDEVKKHLSQLTTREEAARKEKERFEAQAKARREVEARAQREAEEARKTRETAETAIKEKERLEADAKARQEKEESRKTREAALQVKKEAEIKKPPEEKRPPKNKKVWIWSGAGVVGVAAVGILIFMVFGPKGAMLGPTVTTTPTPTLTQSAITPTPTPTPTEPTPTPTTTSPTTSPTPTATTPAAVQPYGTITLASATFSNDAMDPVSTYNTWANALYDPLVTYDETGNYISAIAESWTISPDGNTWTFKIRQGIKFHNGDPLTAEDVKFSVDRFAEDTVNPWAYYLRNNKVNSAVIDDYTFQYVTNYPEPNLVVPFSYVRIIPKDFFVVVFMVFLV